MKKIIGIVIASLMFCNIGFAEIRVIEYEKLERQGSDYFISTVCIDGYKFVTAKSQSADSLSIVQFYTDQSFHKKLALPAEC